MRKRSFILEILNFSITSELAKTSIGFFDKSLVGYRVNLKRGISFRIWGTSVLKHYVIQGYESSIDTMGDTITTISDTIKA
ncbi:MAG: virulence RhuM family protein [Erysipelotrichaceae bacterium]|nr:virulence RhuM family protein [Erysipelotrichaceae bacterium]